MLVITNQRADEPPHRLLRLSPGSSAFTHQVKVIRSRHGKASSGQRVDGKRFHHHRVFSTRSRFFLRRGALCRDLAHRDSSNSDQVVGSLSQGNSGGKGGGR